MAYRLDIVVYSIIYCDVCVLESYIEDVGDSI